MLPPEQPPPEPDPSNLSPEHVQAAEAFGRTMKRLHRLISSRVTVSYTHLTLPTSDLV